MLKKTALINAVLYTVILTVASFVSTSGVPDFNHPNADKAYHFIAYSIFSWLWFTVFSYKLKWHFNKAILYAVILSILFGILIEILQGVLTKDRVTDHYDALANILGVCLTVVILLLIKKTLVKK